MQSTLAVISLHNILQNLKAVKEVTAVPVLAVVKDDAYGHGAERVSLFLEPYVEGFAVATESEGAALRCAGVSKEILVLTPPLNEEEALFCAAHNLTVTIPSAEVFHLAVSSSQKFGYPLRFHLKVNTGMNRYGLEEGEIKGLLRRALSCGAEVTGVFSHLYAPEDRDAAKAQRERFDRACEWVRRIFPHAVRHLAATGGILAGKKYHYDLVRCGIALYGYLPKGFEGALGLKRAMKIYAAVAQSFSFTGGGIGYRRAERDFAALSTLRLGYGDGFFRGGGLGNEAAPLCMDACVTEGSGQAGKRRLILDDFERYARENGTIVYDALVRIGRRAEKKYV